MRIYGLLKDGTEELYLQGRNRDAIKAFKVLNQCEI